jgi:inner membrane protein
MAGRVGYSRYSSIMATLLTHAIVGVALADLRRPPAARAKWWTAAALCSMLPDADVVGFAFGIRYGDLWGHRGITHSLFFAMVVGIAAAWLAGNRGRMLITTFWLFLITASHGLLDAMTNGGLGVAFFSPFNRHRYFFPWRPIAVSPIGTHGLVSSRMEHILFTEFLWVWIPVSVVWVVTRALVKYLNHDRN